MESNEPVEPMEPITTAQFERKASGVAELPDSAAFMARDPIHVEKVIELSTEQYRYFSNHLLEDMPFIAANKHLTGIDERRVTHCLMVTTPGRNSCLLVDTQGYSYSRYTAYVSEKNRVNIEGVPVERLDLKGRDTGGKTPAHKDRNPGQSRQRLMITLEMVAVGMEYGDIAIVDSPHGDGAVCQIGEYHFYFGGQETEEMTAAEYLANVPKDEIAKEILGALEDFRHDPGFSDEYGYYEAFLNERTAERNPREADAPVSVRTHATESDREISRYRDRYGKSRTQPPKRWNPKPPQR